MAKTVTLQQWIEGYGDSLAVLAVELGCGLTTVYRWLEPGAGPPALELVCKLIDMSGGKLTAHSILASFPNPGRTGRRVAK